MPRRASPGGAERDLRRALLDAAADLIAEGGPGAVSLREIARRCGVSHAAPAHHFADRAALLAALAAEGFQLLAAALAATPAEGGARARLVAQGRAYVAFAVSSPGHFPVMFRVELLDCDDPQLLEARIAAFAQLDDAVAAAQAEGWAPGAPRDAAVMAAWASVHGLATLWLDGALPPHVAANDLDDLAAGVTALVGSAGTAPVDAGRAGRRASASRARG